MSRDPFAAWSVSELGVVMILASAVGALIAAPFDPEYAAGGFLLLGGTFWIWTLFAWVSENDDAGGWR